MSKESGGGGQPVDWAPEERIIWLALMTRYRNDHAEEDIYPRASADAMQQLEELRNAWRYKEQTEAYGRQRDEQERREAEQRWAAQGHTENGETEQPHRMLDSLPDADRDLFYFCMKGLSEDIDLADDGEANLNLEAQGEALQEYDAWVQREAARFIAAAEQILGWTCLRSRIETEGSVAPGAPDGPPPPNGNDAA